MELDGYNQELGIAFEHNGVQHYEIDGYLITHSEQLKQREDDDAAKVRLCAANNVALIIVPWNVPGDEIQEFITQELVRRSITPPVAVPFGSGLPAPSILDQYAQFASERGGRLLSDRYGGIEGKLLWQCADPSHGAFEATPNSVINGGRWCRKCANEERAASYQISVHQIQVWAREAGGELTGVDATDASGSLSLKDTAEFRCSLCHRQLRRKVRDVRDGHLCLCRTKKSRIDRQAVEGILSKHGASLVTPLTIGGGKTEVTIRCEGCQTEWSTRARNIVNSGVSCPNCRRNAPITPEKARELADRLGFNLLSSDVRGGMDTLRWQCRECGGIIDKPYRQMRNTRRCPSCTRSESLARLKPLGLGAQSGRELP